jgi:hypothetical protein
MVAFETAPLGFAVVPLKDDWACTVAENPVASISNKMYFFTVVNLEIMK